METGSHSCYSLTVLVMTRCTVPYMEAVNVVSPSTSVAPAIIDVRWSVSYYVLKSVVSGAQPVQPHAVSSHRSDDHYISAQSVSSTCASRVP